MTVFASSHLQPPLAGEQDQHGAWPPSVFGAVSRDSGWPRSLQTSAWATRGRRRSGALVVARVSSGFTLRLEVAVSASWLSDTHRHGVSGGVT